MIRVRDVTRRFVHSFTQNANVKKKILPTCADNSCSWRDTPSCVRDVTRRVYTHSHIMHTQQTKRTQKAPMIRVRDVTRWVVHGTLCDTIHIEQFQVREPALAYMRQSQLCSISYQYTYIDMYQLYIYISCILISHGKFSTGWQRLIGSPELQIIFHKRAIKDRSLLRKMTYQDKVSYESSPPCSELTLFSQFHVREPTLENIRNNQLYSICISIYKCIIIHMYVYIYPP